jgi:copper(I)-binding protein
MRRLLGTAACTALVIVMGACGSDDTSSDEGSGATAVTIDDAWARTTPQGAEAGAAYMILESDDGDRLVGASVDPSVAGKVEIHETVAAESTDSALASDMGSMDTAMGSTDTGTEGMGEMTMRPIDGLDLPAGEAVVLEPGGYHVMLLDLPEPLAADSTFALTLQFENAGEVEIDVPVRDSAP